MTAIFSLLFQKERKNKQAESLAQLLFVRSTDSKPKSILTNTVIPVLRKRRSSLGQLITIKNTSRTCRDAVKPSKVSDFNKVLNVRF